MDKRKAISFSNDFSVFEEELSIVCSLTYQSFFADRQGYQVGF